MFGPFNTTVIFKKSTRSFLNFSCFWTPSRHILPSKYWCGSCSSIVSGGGKWRLLYSMCFFLCLASCCLYFVTLDQSKRKTKLVVAALMLLVLISGFASISLGCIHNKYDSWATNQLSNMFCLACLYLLGVINVCSDLSKMFTWLYFFKLTSPNSIRGPKVESCTVWRSEDEMVYWCLISN